MINFQVFVWPFFYFSHTNNSIRNLFFHLKKKEDLILLFSLRNSYVFKIYSKKREIKKYSKEFQDYYKLEGKKNTKQNIICIVNINDHLKRSQKYLSFFFKYNRTFLFNKHSFLELKIFPPLKKK